MGFDKTFTIISFPARVHAVYNVSVPIGTPRSDTQKTKQDR